VRCTTSSQAIEGASGVKLVTVRIAHASDARTDEEHCDRREHWLSRPSGDILGVTKQNLRVSHARRPDWRGVCGGTTDALSQVKMLGR